MSPERRPAGGDERHTDNTPTVVGIGASAGGLRALEGFFEALPADCDLTFVVIMHLAPDRESELPAILERWTRMPVTQVRDNDVIRLERGHVYVIAPDRELLITDSTISAREFDQPRGQRAAIDVFFRSLAAAHGYGFAVVLSGGGSDGAVGAKAVKEAGGFVLVQDPAEADHDGMPRAVIASGVADLVLPVRELAERLTALAHDRSEARQAIDPDREATKTAESDDGVGAILRVVHQRTGHDFSKYKRKTILRRLSRRLQLGQHASLEEYRQRLIREPDEVQALFDDLLISVTTFFRDPDAWNLLREQVLGPSIEAGNPDETIRAWVPGCATGEEAYTLAIVLAEELERRKSRRSFIIFASDVDPRVLATAREGAYPASIQADVTPARLARYFRAERDRYRVTAAIRDRVVFAVHNLLRDPPFSRLHLITCRNLLIYLGRPTQAQAQHIFRYALRDDGHLFLGVSETADPDLFDPVDKTQRIFRVHAPARSGRHSLPDLEVVPARRTPRPAEPRPPGAGDLHVEALEALAPPSLVVDDRLEVLHLSSSAGRFLAPGGGPIGRHVVRLVRSELRDAVRTGLQTAFDRHEGFLSRPIPVQFNGAPREVMVAVRARELQGRPAALIVFVEGGPAAAPDTTSAASARSDARASRERLDEAELRIERMVSEHQSVEEDLRAANEELQSLNEEYRSTTEELETSKEELQSINEELQTVNHELKLKLEEVSRGHSDLENLMAATDIATLFLDRQLCIVRFTPQLAAFFNVRPHDRGRPIGDITHNLEYQDLDRDARALLRDLTPLERHISSRNGRSLVVRLRPYRTVDDRIDGVVVTLVDVTAVRSAEAALRQSQADLAAEVRTARQLHGLSASVSTARTLQDALDAILGAAIELHGADFGHVQLWDAGTRRLRIVAQRGFAPAFLSRFAEVGAADNTACGRAVRTRQAVRLSDVTRDPADAPHRAAAAEAGYRAVQSVPLLTPGGELAGVISTHFRAPHAFSERDRQLGDLLAREALVLITMRQQQERLQHQAHELVEQDRRKEEFLNLLGHELRNPLAAALNGVLMIAAAAPRPATAGPAASEVPARAVAIVERQLRHMTRLVNDLLDISRINHGSVDLQRAPTELGRAVREALEAIRSSLPAEQPRFDLRLPDAPVTLDVDPERLAQMLDNLLRNAVNYSGPEDTITVSVEVGDATAAIAVRDTGVGMEKEELALVFQPYRRIERGRATAGLGLGLTLVKQLAELHGGSIRAESDGPGTGSAFTLTLPRSASSPEAPAAPTRRQPPRRRVLVVDDEPDVADTFGALLAALGQDVRVAYEGEEALALVRADTPDVAFVDLTMPAMDGFELARRLRRETLNGLVLVAVSGHAPGSGPDRALFDRHLLKPASVDEVIEVLSQLRS